ncbi:peptidoglycan-binding domain-containing protein [Streptomyces sp. NPDC001617]|jgi:murein L,D-transpeptidase YcbB/YkuD
MYRKLAAAAAALAAGLMAMAGAQPASASTSVATIGYGSSNHFGVACVQWAVDWYLDDGSPIAIDGYYGDDTLAAIKEFQRQEGLTRDGLVGPKTGNKVIAVINQYLDYNDDWNFTGWSPHYLSDCYDHVRTSY